MLNAFGKICHNTRQMRLFVLRNSVYVRMRCKVERVILCIIHEVVYRTGIWSFDSDVIRVSRKSVRISLFFHQVNLAIRFKIEIFIYLHWIGAFCDFEQYILQNKIIFKLNLVKIITFEAFYKAILAEQ